MAQYRVQLTKTGDIYQFEQLVPVLGADITLSVVGPHAEKLEVLITSPVVANGQMVRVMDVVTHKLTVKQSRGPFGIDGNEVPSVSYVIENPPQGDLKVTLRSAIAIEGDVAAFLLLGEESTMGLRSHINTLETVEEREIGMTAHLMDASAPRDADGVPMPLAGVTKAEMRVVFPSGFVAQIPMTDDASNVADAVAGDNVYGATFEAVESGTVLMEVTMAGISPDGKAFERVSSHLTVVTRPYADLAGEATLDYAAESETTLRFAIDVDAQGEAFDETRLARITAQVWGTAVVDGVDHLVPVAWIQSLEDIVRDKAGSQVHMDLHHNWVGKAGVVAPFTLRKVVVQDANTNAVLSQREQVYVEHAATLNDRLRAAVPYGADIAIDEEMKMGPRPAKFAMPETTGNGKLLLVHGYCSSEVWPEADFTNAVVFRDLQASRSQDEFARMILEFGEELGPYSAIGHSQGGLALLHLKAYYWSGLDQVTGGRRIQSVGSPYLGCSLAGSIASIGQTFGVGCGSNYDLSVEGAQLWEGNMPVDPRSEVFFYTTQYKPGFLSNCVTASSLVMYTPNDGTAEKKYSILEHATHVNHKEGWCHVSDMKYPPQCEDKERNAEMDAAAAR